MGNGNQAPPLELARLAGGLTFQPQFTFNQRRREAADEINDELTKVSPSNTWSHRGFEVALVGEDKVRIRHLKHQGWSALVSESDIYFRYDSPTREALPETLRVQTELFARLTARLNVRPVRSIGIKFVALKSGSGISIGETAKLLMPSAIRSGEGFGAVGTAPSEVTLRVAYPILQGAASASLQLGLDAETDTFVLDLDCACRDSFAMPTDHLEFFTVCADHYTEVEQQIVADLLQLPSSQPKTALQ